MIRRSPGAARSFPRPPRRGRIEERWRKVVTPFSTAFHGRPAVAALKLPETCSMAKGGDAELMNRWKVQDALETYGCRHWGKGYFSINKSGHVTVHPGKRSDQAIDLKELVDQLQARGIQLPILLRFTDILRHRLGEIQEAFQTAIREF